MTEAYTCGFLFWRDEVLLVRKTRPDWQAGLLNGIGGKMERGEEPLPSMVREFREETGLLTSADCEPGAGPAWHCFIVEHEPWGAVVHFCRASVPDCDPRPRVPGQNDVGEVLSWFHLHGLLCMDSTHAVGNLRWLLPLALDPRQTSGALHVGGDIRVRPRW